VTRPSRAVGGDYYDFMIDGDRLHIALGDVSGKGLGAAMLMVALRATVRSYWRDAQLAPAVARMNEIFNQSVPFDKYATFFVGRLDTPSGRLTYVNAGHNQPLLVRAVGTVERLEEGGTILGAFETGEWTEGNVTLMPGDTLVIFSDGISDLWPDAGLADRRLTELVREHHAQSITTLQTAIFAETDRLGGNRPQDDRTLLLVRRDP
jgi:sigma-B regulation protein RsbU (phosphoserine phosphatase)